MHKVISFGIPSYNAAKDMDHCITSILEGSNYATDIEIIVVDDGSKDETAAKADEWEARYPGSVSNFMSSVRYGSGERRSRYCRPFGSARGAGHLLQGC